MDATGTESAVVVGLSCGALRALLLAADHPNRVEGAVFIGPAFPSLPGRAISPRTPSRNRSTPTTAGPRYNRHYWLVHYAEFLEYFFGQMFSEPHSTKQIEDCVGWGLEMTPEMLIDCVRRSS